MKKADEMEMSINYRAMRCGFVFVETAIMVYCIIMFVTTGELPLIPFIFDCAGSAVFLWMKVYFTHQMTKDNDDDEE